MRIGSDGREEDSDEELLLRTVFSFQKTLPAETLARPPSDDSLSNVETSSKLPLERHWDGPIVELRPPTPVSRRVRPKINHSFEKLIAAGTGPQSRLADDSFWSSLHGDPGPRESADEGLAGDPFFTPDAAFDLVIDKSVSYFDFDPDFHAAPVRSLSLDCMAKLARTFLASDYIRYEDSEQMLAEGILCELCDEPESLHLIIRHLITLVLVGDLATHLRCAVRTLIARVLNAYRGKVVIAERLWSNWSLSSYLMEIKTPDWDRVRELLSIHAEVLNVCVCWISKESIRETLLEAIRLSLDHAIFRVASQELREILSTVISWLDVPRMHLLLEWVNAESTDCSQLFLHHERLVRLCRLMSGSQLGQLAAKIILDCAIFPLNLEGQMRAMSKGDDAEFIMALTQKLSRIPHTPITLSLIQQLHPMLALAAMRVYCTFLEGDCKRECESLLVVLGSLRSAIPTNHYPVYISCKESLSKMETYLRSHLFRSRTHRGVLGKQMTLPVDLEVNKT